MADAPSDSVLASPLHAEHRRTLSRTHSVRQDTWLATSGLVAGMLALPLAQNTWHGPEVAAVLAVSATALFAGQRWAIALIVIAELLLLPTLGPRAFRDLDVVALVTIAAIVPGLLTTRRAATVLVMMTGLRPVPVMCKRVQIGLWALAALAALVPLALR
jgi:hypothetical protein